MADKPHITPEDYVTRLVQVGVWATPQNPIQYAFLEQRPSYLPNEPGWTILTAAQRAAVERAFAMIAEVVNLTFVQVPDNQQEPGPANPRINFYANSIELSYSGSMGAYQLDGSNAIHGADIRFNTARIAQRQTNEQFQDFTSFVALHEVLHGMGLSHPGNYNGQGPTYESHAEFVEDTVQYSAMSYFAAANTGADHFIGDVRYAGRTPLLYDILALHSLYAPNMTTRAGNTVYGFNSNTGANSPFNFAVTTGPVVAIWDGGGIDTIDLSGYSDASLINLNAGAFSDAGGLTKNIAIAFGVTIENAVGGAGDDVIRGNSAANQLAGGAGNDQLVGGGGADLLDGGAGADAMAGELGNDVYMVDNVGDQVIEAAGAGTDEVRTALAAYALGADVEILTGLSSGGQTLTGNGLANIIAAGAGDDVIDGGLGADSMTGGLGNDVFVVDLLGDSVVELGGGGIDEVRTALATYALGANVEILTGLSSGGQALTGNGLDNFIAAGAGNDVIDGGAGADLMYGGLGDDVFIVDLFDDGVVELGGGGSDEIRTALGWFSLEEDPNVERLTGLSDSGQTLIGNDAANILSGGSGNDSLAGGNSADILLGGAGNDLLDGGVGADAMTGGSGNDVYIVDQGGDAVAETADNGTDEIRTGLASYSLAGLVNVENLTGTAMSAQTLTGNDRANVIMGGSGGDVLIGGGGDDYLDGGISGFADQMSGGTGNDIYIVDHGGNDIVTELAGEGTDEVRAQIFNYDLAANVENLTGTGSQQSFRDNTLDNIITMRAGLNTVRVSAGHDVVHGGTGGDTLTIEWGDSVNNLTIAWPQTANVVKGEYDGAYTDGSGRSVTFTSIGRLIVQTGSGNDTISFAIPGTPNPHFANAGAGDDVVDVGTATGGADGGSGVDKVIADFSVWTGAVDYSHLANFEYFDLRTGSGNDILYSGTLALPDALRAGAGFDQIVVRNGHDVVDGGAGEDRLIVEWQNLAGNVAMAGPLAASPGGGWQGGFAAADYSVAFVGIETFYVDTGSGNDDVAGGSGEDRFTTGAGNDRLDGGTGADILTGGTGDDIYFVDDGGDQVFENLGDGNDEIRTTLATYSLAGKPWIEKLTGLGAGDQSLTGNDLDNVIDGGVGADAMTGGQGHDVYFVDNAGDIATELANEGTDEIRTALAVLSIAAFANVEKLTGLSGDGQTLTGNGLANIIVAGSGNDVLDGGANADSMTGGLGNDVYGVDNAGDSVIELSGGGTDEIRTALSAFSLAGSAEVENLTGISNGGQALTGNGLANFILGGSGNDVIDGGAGADVLRGALGNDVYVVDNVGDNLDELAGGGTDEVRTSLAAFSLYTLTNFENLTGTSASGQILEGNDLVNVIVGGSGGDLLIGGLGADVLRGALGNDIYIVDDESENLDEIPGGGTDEIRTALAGFSLANLASLANFENLTGLGGGDQNFIGNSLGNVIDGGLGADAMAGGAGNDTYIVDNVGDTVTELAGEGVDEVRTGLGTYVPGANVENLTATSDVAHDFRGNAGNNVVTGAAGNDTFRMQEGGTDTVNAGNGNDFFLFGASLDSSDAVDGGAGTDQLAIQGNYTLTFGGGFVNIESLIPLPGNDVRFGDSGANFYDYALATVDANVAAGQRLTVDANRLRAGEDFTFDGTAESDGNFFLIGGNGVDLLLGGAQSDTFLFGENGQFGAGDVVNGGSGGSNDQLGLRGNYTIVFGAGQLISIESISLVSAQDTRFGPLGSVHNYNLTMNDGNVAAGQLFTVDAAPLRGGETLTFNGGAELNGAFRVAGGAGNDTIIGSAGGDILIARGGADAMTGGAGNDQFRYNEAADSTAAVRDTILDFTTGDVIDLARIDAIAGTPANDAFTFIGSTPFGNVAGELRAFSTGGNNWTIQGDVNGDGGADFELLVTTGDGHILTGTGDFML